MKIKIKKNNPSTFRQAQCLASLRDGFTLVETILYVAIISMVLGAIISFAIYVQEPREKIYGNQEVDTNARFILNEISKQIRKAEGIDVSASVFDVDPGVLSLEMSDPALNPALISLDADDGNCQISFGIDSPIVLNSGKVKVTNLVFSNLSLNSDRQNIKIDLTVETISGQDYVGYGKVDLQTSVTTKK